MNLRFLNVVHEGKRELAMRARGGIVTIDRLRKISGRKYPGAGSTDDIIRQPALASQIASDFVRHTGRLLDGALEDGDVKFLPCVLRPGKIVCIGLNYRKHAEEVGAALPQHPVVFSKFSDCVAGHLEDIPIPRDGWNVDYEAELGMVFGSRASTVSCEAALNHVFGYFAANDVSAREMQLRTSQWLIGKTSPGFAPIGPDMVTSDELGSPDNLNIRCRVNGEVRQNSSTSDMIFRCDYIISYISKYFPLNPGDILLTGTPEGVVLGSRNRRRWLTVGDTVEVEIEKIGVLKNTFSELAP